MSRFYFFKISFVTISAGLFVGTIVYGLFDLDLSNKEDIIKLILKALFSAICTGFFLGVLNILFKIGPTNNSNA